MPSSRVSAMCSDRWNARRAAVRLRQRSRRPMTSSASPAASAPRSRSSPAALGHHQGAAWRDRPGCRDRHRRSGIAGRAASARAASSTGVQARLASARAEVDRCSAAGQPGRPSGSRAGQPAAGSSAFAAAGRCRPPPVRASRPVSDRHELVAVARRTRARFGQCLVDGDTAASGRPWGTWSINRAGPGQRAANALVISAVVQGAPGGVRSSRTAWHRLAARAYSSATGSHHVPGKPG